ncbi:hypothetical protein E8E11_004121 [Didymella keratinophila]|nr:hypothetical protein E8E11_004121 [Didymella keratinophila]
MDFPVVDIQSRFVNALRTQRSYKTQDVVASPLACPFGHQGRIFQNIDQLLAHRKEDYPSEFNGLDVQQAKPMIQKNVIQARNVDEPGSSQTRVDIDGLFLNSGKQRLTSPTSRKKRRADFKLDAQRTKAPTHVETINSDYSKDIPFAPKAPKLRTKPHESRLFNFKRPGKDNETSVQSSMKVSEGHASRTKQEQAGSAAADRQSGLMELQKDDPRYPGFLLQPGSQPISQEQLASEVKNIYTGLIMVETECIRVERAQAAAPKDPEGGVLDPDHWQALIALHRTLLHEHHDFFLAAQHPSANPALRRLAGKYTMPALLWKHGIHSFLELLCQRLPGSPDMLAFIHLAYQMMALLYETVPAFEDTWIECLGDLGRYRMAIEDEDIRDRETWANVARFWYSKAADKNPAFDRLYHYLVIPALPNALQQLYYYLTLLNSVDPFHTARQSIMTQFRSHFPDGPPRPGVPIDTTFIKYHALLFTRWQEIGYESASTDFLGSLDNHIGGVTAKWKEQGVCTAVSNIAAWFDYGVDANLHRQIFLLRESHRETLCLEVSGFSGHDDEPADVLTQDSAFAQAQRLTDHTLSLVLRRIGDKNVLPHDHVMLSFLSTLASTPYVSHLIQDTPWTESTSFLDTLIKNEESKNPPSLKKTFRSHPMIVQALSSLRLRAF